MSSMPPSAQRFVLDILFATGEQPVPVRALLRAGAPFGLTDNNLRVGVARLCAEGKIERRGRGLYGLAPGAEPVRKWVARWSTPDARLAPWLGGFVGAHHVPGPTRRDAKARRCVRALSFLGMRELAPGLHVRPDNLVGGVEGVREELRGLGLPASSPVFAIGALDDEATARACALWDVAALEREHRRLRLALERSERRLPRLPLEEAIVECFVLGGRAIRQLAYDPLLPEPIAKAAPRRALVDAMRRYDVAGRDVWRELMRSEGGPAPDFLPAPRREEHAA